MLASHIELERTMASLDREIIALTKRVERTVAVSHTAQFKAAAARKVQTTRGIEAIIQRMENTIVNLQTLPTQMAIANG